MLFRSAGVKDREINQQIINDGMRPVGTGAAAMDKLLKDEIALWAKVIQDTGIKIAE